MVQAVKCVQCGGVAVFDNVREMLAAGPLLVFGGTGAEGGVFNHGREVQAVVRDGLCGNCALPLFERVYGKA